MINMLVQKNQFVDNGRQKFKAFQKFSGKLINFQK